MKRKVLLFFALIFTLVLTACDGFADVKMEIKGINGVTDADINLTESSVKFSVSSEIETFAVADIIVPADVKVEAYSDKGYNSSLGPVLTLNEGENVFYLKLTSKLLSDNWTLYITKLSNSVKTPKSLTVKSLDETYNLNEELSKGVLLLTYTDGSTKEVEITKDMVSGFDTKSYGERKLTISYEGLVTTFNYKVISNIVSISVSENWPSDYLIGSTDIYPNGILTVTLENGGTERIVITRYMVSEFNTSIPGDKELVITYKDKTTKFGYSVHQQYTNVSIEGLKTEYKYGEALVGYVKFVLGDYVFTKPLTGLASGYDPYTYGEQTISIPQYNLTAKVKVEKESTDDFEGPTESNITYKDLEEVFAIVYAVGNSASLSGEEYDKYYNEALTSAFDTSIKNEIVEIARKCGVTVEQINKVLDIYKKEAKPLLEPYFEKINNGEIGGYSELFKSISAEDIAVLQNIIDELLDIIDPKQITVLIKETESFGVSVSNEWHFIPTINIDKSFKEIEYKDYIKVLKAAGLNNVVEFMELMEESDYNLEISADHINVMVETGFMVLEAFVKVDANDIHELLNYVVDLSLGDKKIDKNELLDLIHKAGSVLEQLLIDSNILSDLEELFADNYEKLLINNMSHYEYTIVVTIKDLVSLYGDDLIEVIQNVTLDQLEVIIDFIKNAENPSDKEIAKFACVIAKLVEPILLDVNSSDEAKSLIAKLCVAGTSDKKVYSFISTAVTWLSLDYNNLSNDEVESICEALETVASGEDYINVSGRYREALIPVGSSNEDLLRELNDKFTLSYIDADGNNTPIQLTENTVKGLDTKTKGWHTVTVSQQGIIVELYYYVFDPNNEGVITNVYNINQINEYVLYFEKNNENPDEYGVNKHQLAEGYSGRTEINWIFEYVYYRYFLQDSGIESTLNIVYDDLEFVVDRTTTGLKYGYAKYPTLFGDILIPFQCYVYDQNNPVYEAEDVEIYVGQYNSFYDSINVECDFGRDYQYIGIEINSNETEEIKTFTKVINNITFTIHVVSENDLNKIKKVNYFELHADASDITNTYKNGRITFSYQTNGSYNYGDKSFNSFSHLEDYLNEFYGNASIVFDWGTYEDLDSAMTTKVYVPYVIYSGSTVIWEGEARVELVSHDQFYSYWYSFEYKDYDKVRNKVVDSYDEVTKELAFENAYITKHYQYLNDSFSEQITLDEFLNEAKVEIKLIEEYDYYRVYEARYWYNEYSWSSVEFRVCLTENKDVVVYRNLYFREFTLVNTILEQDIIDELERKVELKVERASGEYEYITGLEAMEYLSSLNPHYYITIDGTKFSVQIEYEIDGVTRTDWTYGNCYIVDETSNVWASSTTIYPYELTKESIFEAICKWVSWIEFDLTDGYFSLWCEDYDINDIEIITDLSNRNADEFFELEITYYGAKIVFMACPTIGTAEPVIPDEPTAEPTI